MQFNEAEVSSVLSGIQERMARGRVLRFVELGGKEQEHYRRQNAKIWLHRPTYPEARSDFFVIPEEIGILEGRITQVRRLIFSEGQDYTNNSDYPRFTSGDLQQYNFRTDDEWRRMHFLYRNGFHAHADLEPLLSEKESEDRSELGVEDFENWRNTLFASPSKVDGALIQKEGNPGDRLYLMIDSPGRNIEFRFGFRNDFILAILFQPSGYYHTSRTPITEMTHEEFIVVDYFMGRFIAEL